MHERIKLVHKWLEEAQMYIPVPEAACLPETIRKARRANMAAHRQVEKKNRKQKYLVNANNKDK